MTFCFSKLLHGHSELPYPSPKATSRYKPRTKATNGRKTVEKLHMKVQYRKWFVHYSLQTYSHELSWGEGRNFSMLFLGSTKRNKCQRCTQQAKFTPSHGYLLAAQSNKQYV